MATLSLVAIAFPAGLALRSPTPVTEASDPPAASAAAEPVAATLPRRVLFAERLGESLELESYRTQFTRDDTIAWRAEFTERTPTGELTVVIAWQSIRERMQLSETTVTRRDTRRRVVASDEVRVGDLVPTAGLYSVSYYADDTKLAEGVFELLPPDR